MPSEPTDAEVMEVLVRAGLAGRTPEPGPSTMESSIERLLELMSRRGFAVDGEAVRDAVSHLEPVHNGLWWSTDGAHEIEFDENFQTEAATTHFGVRAFVSDWVIGRNVPGLTVSYEEIRHGQANIHLNLEGIRWVLSLSWDSNQRLGGTTERLASELEGVVLRLLERRSIERETSLTQGIQLTQAAREAAARAVSDLVDPPRSSRTIWDVLEET